MPCIPMQNEGTEARRREVKQALDRLEKYLARGTTSLVVSKQGAVAFRGWDANDRNGVTDLCAYRALSQAGSWELRKAQARAEMVAGAKVDQKKVADGVHSHDGGKTWGTH